MNGKSPNLPSPRFSSGNDTPSRNNQINPRQPLYLQPNSPFMSPRGSRMSTPSRNYESPDFIPLGVSSPVSRARQSWSGRHFSNNSSYTSSPPSSNSSHNFSPYRRNSFRGNFRGRSSNTSKNSGPNSPHISLYVDKDALVDPWAELEEKMKKQSFTHSVIEENKDFSTIGDNSSDESSNNDES